MSNSNLKLLSCELLVSQPADRVKQLLEESGRTIAEETGATFRRVRERDVSIDSPIPIEEDVQAIGGRLAANNQIDELPPIWD